MLLASIQAPDQNLKSLDDALKTITIVADTLKSQDSTMLHTAGLGVWQRFLFYCPHQKNCPDEKRWSGIAGPPFVY